jgi:hypothetical protein
MGLEDSLKRLMKNYGFLLFNVKPYKQIFFNTVMINKKWHCQYCPQTSSRYWNLKKHIERKHNGIGQPIREDRWHSTPSAIMGFIPDMNSLQNHNNYYLNHRQRHPQTFSSALPSYKKEDISKKRDTLDETLELWRPMAQKMKEILEIKKTFNEFFPFFSSSQQPNIISGIGQTPNIESIKPSPVTTTPSQQAPESAQSSEQQEQKKQNINRWATFNARLFFASTFQVKEFQRRIREGKIEHFMTIPLEQGPLPIITNNCANNNKNNSKKRGEANSTDENTIEEELEDHYI